MFFGRQALFAMIKSPVLSRGTLAYVDVDTHRLSEMMKLGEKAIRHSGSTLKLEGSANRCDVLKGADFVVLSFADRGVHFRGVDCSIAVRHGIRMCSGDTIGPGGIFRAMRELPKIMEAAKDVREICPDAWLINYINPTAVNGVGLQRFGNVKTFALCDGLHMPHVKRNYMKMAGIEVTPQSEAKFDLRIGGVNHFTWVLSCTFDGRDVTDKLREHIGANAAQEKNSGHSKSRFNATYTLELDKIYGRLPACIGHTKEYVRFWQGMGIAVDLPPLAIFDTVERHKLHAAQWEQIAKYNSGEVPMQHFFDNMRPDHATDIVEAMWSKAGKQFYVNTPNRGAVTNLPDDAFLELLSDIDMDGPRPRPCGTFPAGLTSMQMQVLDAHALTAEAIVKSDRDLLLRALCTDPLSVSIADSREMIDEVLREEKDALPESWYKN
jgi:alpha-galactosidase